jgi:hypothetical protein
MSTEWWVACSTPQPSYPRRKTTPCPLFMRSTTQPLYPVQRPPGNHFLWSLMDRSTTRPLYPVERPPGTHFYEVWWTDLHHGRFTPYKYHPVPIFMKFNGQIHTTSALSRTKTTRYPLLWSLMDRSTPRPRYSVQNTTWYTLIMKSDGPDSPDECTILKCLCGVRNQNASYPAVPPVAWSLHWFGYSSPRHLI